MSIKMPANPAEPQTIFNDVTMGYLVKDLTGLGSLVALTDVEAQQAVHVYAGTLAVNTEIIVPSESKIYFVANATTGAFTLTIKTATGTGITVAQDNKAILVCDGVDVLRFSNDIP